MSRLIPSRRLSLALLVLALAFRAAPVCHATDGRPPQDLHLFRWLNQLVAWVLESGMSMDPNGGAPPAPGASSATGDATAAAEGGGSMDPNGR